MCKIILTGHSWKCATDEKIAVYVNGLISILYLQAIFQKILITWNQDSYPLDDQHLTGSFRFDCLLKFEIKTNFYNVFFNVHSENVLLFSGNFYKKYLRYKIIYSICICWETQTLIFLCFRCNSRIFGLYYMYWPIITIEIQNYLFPVKAVVYLLEIKKFSKISRNKFSPSCRWRDGTINSQG